MYFLKMEDILIHYKIDKLKTFSGIYFLLYVAAAFYIFPREMHICTSSSLLLALLIMHVCILRGRLASASKAVLELRSLQWFCICPRVKTHSFFATTAFDPLTIICAVGRQIDQSKRHKSLACCVTEEISAAWRSCQLKSALRKSSCERDHVCQSSQYILW
jgi:hypothetical protein